jgi:xylulokinase
VVEGLLCALADGIAHLTCHGIAMRRVLLVGGGARSRALRTIAPAVFGVPVIVPSSAEYVALGAARQAAWALTGSPQPPAWEQAPMDQYTAEPVPAVHQRYASVRDLTDGA